MAHRVSKSKKEISALTEKELRVKEKELKDQILNLRLQWRTGQLGNWASMRLTRKEMARVQTFLAQKLEERKKELAEAGKV